METLPTYITLAQAQERLGDDVRICLEPEDRMHKALASDDPAKAAALWFFDPERGMIRREDQEYFQVEMRDRGGYFQPAVNQEPGIPEPETGERITAYVRVMVNYRGFVRTRIIPSLVGQMLEVNPTSKSKDEPLPEGARRVRTAYIHADPQRIIDGIEADLIMHDFPDEEGMRMDMFVSMTQDCRSLGALAALRILGA